MEWMEPRNSHIPSWPVLWAFQGPLSDITTREVHLSASSSLHPLLSLPYFSTFGSVQWYSHFGKSVWKFFMKLNIYLVYVSSFFSMCFSKTHSSIFPKWDLYMNVYSSLIHKSPKLELLQILTDRKHDKQIVV